MPPGADGAARLRLASGLVLIAFAASHLANRALGVVSLEAMERGLEVFVAGWRSPLGTLLLYGALLLHIGLVLAKLYQRRSLRVPAWQAGQIVLGLVIPLLLTAHVVGTRGVSALYGVEDSYARVLLALWPDAAPRQSLLLLVVWLHGCLGLHYWLRLRPWYPAARPWLLAAAVLLPTLALIGFANGGREVRALAEAAPARIAAVAEADSRPGSEADAAAALWRRAVLTAFVAAVALLLVARGVRAWWRRRGVVRLSYPGGRRVAVPKGATILEASRVAGIPHAAVCGGRGRCSTCRVRVGDGAEHLPPPSPGEARVLARLGLTDGSVRLACQLRPTHDLAVVPLLPATAGPREAHAPTDPALGVEREVAVLFADLRGFTRLAESRLPYDTVFLLNRYFQAMGQAVEAAGGRVDKFIGDGVMALFGVERGAEPPAPAARQALAAARAMALALDRLNHELKGELAEPLRMAIGLHAGPVILGEMGDGRARSLTAVGDAVNVASRLEALSKIQDAQLVVSEELAALAGTDLSAFERREVEVRGRRRRLAVRVVPDARNLPAAATAGTAATDRRRSVWVGLLLWIRQAARVKRPA